MNLVNYLYQLPIIFFWIVAGVMAWVRGDCWSNTQLEILSNPTWRS
jgi:hypothetical protein